LSANGSSPLGQVEYADLVGRVQEVVAGAVPPNSSVLVVSKGDEALLALPGRTAAHFPQDSAGEYAGHHPLDSAAATAALERLRRQGAEYLVIPATARWWLEFYSEFATHLATHGDVVADEPDSCLVYGLGRFGGARADLDHAGPDVSIDQMRDYLEHLVSAGDNLVVLEEDADGLTAGLAPLQAIRLLADEEAAEAEGEALLAELEHLAAAGADYLVVPRSVDEWFDRRSGLSARIEGVCRKVADQRHLCRVFDLDDMRGLRR
jgi:hypothetical protein